jgi:predicted nuclease with TOPRIM domain
LKEREASHFSEENRELRSKLEETLTQNMDLERKYEAVRKSFNEVRESLILLRDSCKTNYYNLSEIPE